MKVTSDLLVIKWHVDVMTCGKQVEFDDGHVWTKAHSTLYLVSNGIYITVVILLLTLLVNKPTNIVIPSFM